MKTFDSEFIIPDWPAPPNIAAACTTRRGGVSKGPWASLNLGDHVGDDPRDVIENRRRLIEWSGLETSRFEFMAQIHGTDVVDLPVLNRRETAALQADGCVTSARHQPCLVMTADCLPVLFCDRSGTWVAAAHAGWRGLCAGVLERTVASCRNPGELMAWLGPAIGADKFEVGEEVLEAFMAKDSAAESAFRASPTAGHYLADLYALARQRLQRVNVTAIYGGHWCTYTDTDRFFSFRRDGTSGRMASLIYIS